jgi:hypothetical protein
MIFDRDLLVTSTRVSFSTLTSLIYQSTAINTILITITSCRFFSDRRSIHYRLFHDLERLDERHRQIIVSKDSIISTEIHCPFIASVKRRRRRRKKTSNENESTKERTNEPTNERTKDKRRRQ